MKSNQKDKNEKEYKTGNRQDQLKGNNDRSKTARKNDDRSLGETKVEPTPPDTPDTPDIPIPPHPSGDPRREYDDTGHEHVHHPPKADNSSHVSMHGFLGE